jgi:GT2 family glycosyltransferase
MLSLYPDQKQCIKVSKLFNADWYVSRYNDVKLSGIDPLEHFLSIGIFLQRNPCTLFDTAYYLSQFSGEELPELPFLDYLQNGWKKFHNPHPLFDVGYYLDQNEDIRAAGVEPLGHFHHFGGLEGRQPHPSFPTHRVLKRCPWLHDSRFNPLEFYLAMEWIEDPCCEATQFLSNKSAHIDREAITIVDGPLVSIVTAVYKTPMRSLQMMFESVQSQNYLNWELCIVDDGSCDPALTNALIQMSEKDRRVKLLINNSNEGISHASNKAIELACGKYIAFLDHDDTLAPNALQRCVETLLENDADAVYTDQDTVTDAGEKIWTFYKPTWSPEYLLHVMYVGHLLVVRAKKVRELNGFNARFDGVQDFEFMLRLSELTGKVLHIPEVLYHWHAIDGSIAASSDAKKGVSDSQVIAVQEYLDRNSINAKAFKHPLFPHRCSVEPYLKSHPKVSIIIPSKDQPEIIKTCLESIFAKTSYPNFEVLVVDTGTTDPKALQILDSYQIRIVPYLGKFNFSAACNLGADNSLGEILVFLNNDTEVITANWLDHLVFHLTLEDVGAVGSLLLYPNGNVQHAGVVLGARGTADHVARNFPADSDGYAGSLSCPREVSAVTGACLATKKSLFFEAGQFSELYATHYQDVDFCLKLRARGMRCLYTPEAKLYHHESISRGHESYDFIDRLLFIDSWREILNKPDPYYPASLSLERLDYSQG